MGRTRPPTATVSNSTDRKAKRRTRFGKRREEICITLPPPWALTPCKHESFKAMKKARKGRFKGITNFYEALENLVKERNESYEGPEEKRRYYTGARHLRLARRRGDDYCKSAINDLLDFVPLRPRGPDPETIKALKERTERCANAALTHYNQQHPGAEFELVEPICSNFARIFTSVSFVGRWFHVNFKAKPKNATTSDDPSPKLFFSELSFDSHEPIVTACSIVDPNNSEVTPGCRFCDPYGVGISRHKLFHVVGGFSHGSCSRRQLRRKYCRV